MAQPKPVPKDLIIPSDLNLLAPGPDIAAIAKRKAAELKAFKQRRVKVIKDFRIWAKKDHAKEYTMFEPIGGLILLRLFVFAPPDSKTPKIYTGFDDDGSGQQKLKAEMFPYAKVLQMGSEVPEAFKDLGPNSVVLIQDSMCGVEPNTEWREWKMIMAEKPSIEREWPQPPKYIPTLSKWGPYVFKRDKFMPGNLTEDAYTFLVPASMIRCMVNVDELK